MVNKNIKSVIFDTRMTLAQSPVFFPIALVFAVLYSWSPSTPCTYGLNMPSNINKIAADLSQFFHVSSVFAKSVSTVSLHMTERRVHA